MKFREKAGVTYAPVHGRIVLAALAVTLLMAIAVCALHWENAVSLRGRIPLSDCAVTDGLAEGLTPLVETARAQRGILYIDGALVREGGIGEVRLRVALIARDMREAILLNTQMVRRFDLARELGCDDHCGFAAAAQVKRLSPGTYDIALLDEADGERRLVTTACTLTIGKAGSVRLGN